VAAHEAARKFLHLDSESDLDVNERYFWALSFGSHPQQQVIKGEALAVVLNGDVNKWDRIEDSPLSCD
jgi:hypothetical protein